MKIINIKALEILDSRGNPTIEVNLELEDGSRSRAMVPSGASTGKNEAYELRDNDMQRYNGKGVLKAVKNINTIIKNAIVNKEYKTQSEFDRFLLTLDGSENKSNLGANAILGASMAFLRVNALSHKIPLYRYIRSEKSNLLPVPCMNIINGGKHADNNVDFQEFMIAPNNSNSFSNSIRMGIEVFHTLKTILAKKGLSTGVGDEGGFAPDLRSNDEAVEIILEAIIKAGYKPGIDVSLCLDPATSEMWENGKYKFFKSTQKIIGSDEMIELWKSWISQYPIVLIEDGLAENDWTGWQNLTKEIGSKIELVGDDIFCTNKKLLQKGIEKSVANSILIKLNQIGTVSETLETIDMAYKNGYNCFISHRSGETVDTIISDLTVAVRAGHLKTGSGCRGERIEKFNQLIRIEQELGSDAEFAGEKAFKNFS
jgi:enolase